MLINKIKLLIPITVWLPKYDWHKNFKYDVIAGITIALYGVPQGLSYALLAGLPLYYGLYTAFIPGIAYAFLGTSKHIAVGCLSIPALMVGAVVNEKLGLDADEDEYVRHVMILTVCVGTFYLIVSFLRLAF